MSQSGVMEWIGPDGDGDGSKSKDVAALRLANRALVAAVESSPFVMALWDDEFICVAVSNGSLRLVHGGRSREEVVGMPIHRLHAVSEDGDLDNKLGRLRADGEVMMRARIAGGDGAIREFAVMARANVAPGLHATTSLVGLPAGRDDGDARDPVAVVVATPDEMAAAFIDSSLAHDPKVASVIHCRELDRLHSAVLLSRPEVTIFATSPFLPPGKAIRSVELLDRVKTLAEFARANSIETAILVLDHQERPAVARAALEAGAQGVLGPQDAHRHFRGVLARVADGGQYLSPALSAALAKPDRRLSARELGVLRLLALGYTNKEVAAELFISVRTVENHRARIHSRMGFSSRRDLVAWAIDNQVIP